MGIFGLAVALILLAAWKMPKPRWLIPSSFLLVVVAFLNYRSSLANLLDPNHPIGIAAVLRLDMWRQALYMIRDTLFTGVGPDNFSIAQTNFYVGHLIGPESHAHNLLLQ